MKKAKVKIKNDNRDTIQLKMVYLFLLFFVFVQIEAQKLYDAPAKNTHTRWVSPENPTGEKGKGSQLNKGAKGRPFYIIAPGEKKVIFDQNGAGIIQRMWMSGTIARVPEQRRGVRIDMYWDGATKPAVSAPIGDFFGTGLGLMAPFDSELFSNPEGRSFNFTIPMPYKKSAKIEITNESSTYVLFWYDINFLKMDKLADDIMYFHAYWNRNMETELGNDYVILPEVKGTGRYLGTNIGVIGNPHYNGSWFGEGEVKVYLDGDENLPTLVGTGTEDYIGTGWGQGQYQGQYFGSLISNKEKDLYAFYRYHTRDAVYFHEDIKVTIQQIGATTKEKIKEMLANGAKLKPVWIVDSKGVSDIMKMRDKRPELIRLLDLDKTPDINSDEFPNGATGFYRSDDVSATAYFYLNSPENNLPLLPPIELRLKDLDEKVWSKVKPIE